MAAEHLHPQAIKQHNHHMLVWVLKKLIHRFERLMVVFCPIMLQYRTAQTHNAVVIIHKHSVFTSIYPHARPPFTQIRQSIRQFRLLTTKIPSVP